MCAVKILNIVREKHRRSANREKHILSMLHHPNIIELIEIFEFKTHLCLVLELADEGLLLDHVRRLSHYSEQTASHFTRQILKAVQFMHSRHVMHRDLKNNNILVCRNPRGPVGIIKVIDFGLGTCNAREGATGIMGTRGYQAPEVWAGKPYGPSIDVWAVGVILFRLVTGKHAFPGVDSDDIDRRVQEVDYRYPNPELDPISSQVKNLIRRLLSFDPQSRPTATTALQHTWIANADRNDDRHRRHTIAAMGRKRGSSPAYRAICTGNIPLAGRRRAGVTSW